jgi:hypothetical protein
MELYEVLNLIIGVVLVITYIIFMIYRSSEKGDE